MSLNHTLLGFLNYGPQTGYDLKKHMDNSTQFFWNARLSQIYPALKKMEESGFIISSIMPQTGKPDKKYYMITDTGRNELLSWLDEFPKEVSHNKAPEMLKVFFAGAMEKEKILNHLRHQLSLHQIQLRQYETETKLYSEKIIEETGLEKDGIFWDMTRQFGEAYERMYITWLQEAIETTENKL
ncbi:MAG: PadR family transcriptional regulator [Anaerolineaceae bacterium]|nr:PadR family transcriptional regulator [Anaerolineaceae bacterium]